MALRDSKGRFIKGSVPNPNGRPPKEREIRYFELTKSAVSEADWVEIIQTTVKFAKRGDSQARKFLADYLLGPPTQKMELTGKDGMPLVVKWDDSENND